MHKRAAPAVQLEAEQERPVWAEQPVQAEVAQVVQAHPPAAAPPEVAQAVQAHPATVGQPAQPRAQVGSKEVRRAFFRPQAATIPSVA